MMLYPAMSDLSEHISNRYLMVNVAARRARQIAQQATDEKRTLSEKSVTTAIREIADGTIDESEVDTKL